MAILEEAAQIVEERLDLFNIVLADKYYMAMLAEDRGTQHEIREEALESHNTRLLEMLSLVETGEW